MTSGEKFSKVQKFSKFADKDYRFCGQRGGRGSKYSKILWTSYMEAPFRHYERRMMRKRGFARQMCDTFIKPKLNSEREKQSSCISIFLPSFEISPPPASLSSIFIAGSLR